MRTIGRPRRVGVEPEDIRASAVRRTSAEVHISALALIACGGGLLLSALVDLTDGGPDAAGLAVVGIGASALGAFLRPRFPMPYRIPPRASLRTVGVSLAVMILTSIVAYRVTGAITRPGEALMESTAGFTTTALTVLADPEAESRGILFWRAMTQWIGGFAALATVIAVLPFLGVSGPAHTRTRLPRASRHLTSGHVRRLLGRYLGLYLTLTVVGAALYLIGGMGLFDATTYSFTTISTGGFANHGRSFAFFDSALLDWMGVAGMFLGGLSLAVVWSVLRGRSRGVLGYRELWAYCGLIVGATTVIAVVERPGGDLFENVRLSAFTATSAVSSTGHWVTDWSDWAPGPQMMLLVLIGLGAMSGSMGGGFRIVRGMVLFSYLSRELDTQLRPRVVRVVRVGPEVIDERLISRILGYQVLYLGAAAAGFLALALAGADVVTALSGSVSALATYGPALGDLGVGSPLSLMGRDGLVVLLILMFAGRIELYPFLDAVVASVTWPLQRIRRSVGTGMARR